MSSNKLSVSGFIGRVTGRRNHSSSTNVEPTQATSPVSANDASPEETLTQQSVISPSSSTSPSSAQPAPVPFQIDWASYNIQAGSSRATLRRKKRATAASWSLGMHTFLEPHTIPWTSVCIRDGDLWNALMGFIPRVMEDKWFIWAEDVEDISIFPSTVEEDRHDNRKGRSRSDHKAAAASSLESPPPQAVQVASDPTGSESSTPHPSWERFRNQPPNSSSIPEAPNPPTQGLRLHFIRSWTGFEVLRLNLQMEPHPRPKSQSPLRALRSLPTVRLRSVSMTYETAGERMNWGFNDEYAKETIKGLASGYLGCLIEDIKQES